MKLEKYFQDSYKNLQPFKSVVSIGKNRKDNLLIERFAKLIIKIQNRLKSYVESPEIEILLIHNFSHQIKFSLLILSEVVSIVISHFFSKRKLIIFNFFLFFYCF